MAVVMAPGSPAEATEAMHLFPRANILTGVNMGVYGALMQRAHAVVANDTGPGHLAAVSGARTVSIYGPTAEERWSPIGKNLTLLWPDHNWPGIDEVLAALSCSACR